MISESPLMSSVWTLCSQKKSIIWTTRKQWCSICPFIRNNRSARPTGRVMHTFSQDLESVIFAVLSFLSGGVLLFSLCFVVTKCMQCYKARQRRSKLIISNLGYVFLDWNEGPWERMMTSWRRLFLPELFNRSMMRKRLVLSTSKLYSEISVIIWMMVYLKIKYLHHAESGE